VNKIPARLNKYLLNFKSVHIQCLDENKNSIKGAYASGFIVKQNGELYLYTCWHVVTGFNMHNIEIKGALPNRKFLEVNLQKMEQKPKGFQAIGGKQTSKIPLYDDNGLPLWIQDKHDNPNFSLNNIGIKVPLWHDTIKLQLPNDISVSDIQIINYDEFYKYEPGIGDKVFIVGYPYGYSSLGLETPTPIVLTRFIAADKIKGRRTEILLDGSGAPGMSGGPIFIETNTGLLLLGIYTGIIYPDYEVEGNEKTTALGTMSKLLMWFSIFKI
jgi:hypothetical protein